MNKIYKAIKDVDQRFMCSWDKRDPDKGIQGELKLRSPAKGIEGELKVQDEMVLFSGEDKNLIEEKIKTYYYDNKNETIYLCDEQNLIYGSYLHKGEANARDQFEELKFTFCCVIVLSILSIVTAASFSYDKHGIISTIPYLTIFSTLALYYFMTRIYNAAEGCMVTIILSIIIWLIIVWCLQTENTHAGKQRPKFTAMLANAEE